VTLAGALALAAAVAGAAPTVKRADSEKLEARYRAARVERNIGWGLAAAGTALVAAGAIAVGYAARDNVMTYEQHVGEAIGGAAAMSIGLALAIPGAVLSFRGQDAMAEVTWRWKLAIAPTRDGAMAAIGVRF
jgi:hypothetical protein